MSDFFDEGIKLYREHKKAEREWTRWKASLEKVAEKGSEIPHAKFLWSVRQRRQPIVDVVVNWCRDKQLNIDAYAPRIVSLSAMDAAGILGTEMPDDWFTSKIEYVLEVDAS